MARSLLRMSARLTHRRALSLMVLSAVVFTANVLLVRALGQMGQANIWLISCVRFVVGLALIAIAYRREFAPTHLWRNTLLVQRGILGGFGVYVTYLCVVQLGAGRAIFINNTYVIWGALLAAWLLHERLRSAVLIGSVTAIAGLALLTHVFSLTSHPGLFDLVAFGSAWLSGYIVVTIRQLHGTEHTSTIFAAQCVYGLLICTVPAVYTYTPLSGLAWVIIVIAGLTAAIGQLAMTRAFRDLPVAEGSLIQMLVPLFIAIGGVLFFHEHFSAQELAGAALILGGMAFTVVTKPASIGAGTK